MIGLGLLGSLAGVLALAGVAWWLGLGRTDPLTQEEVSERAAFEFGPLSPRGVFVDQAGAAGLLLAEDGRAVLIKRHGNHPASRLLTPPVRWREKGEALVFPTADRMFGDLRLHLPPAERDRLLAML
jgi:hypothetical protein